MLYNLKTVKLNEGVRELISHYNLTEDDEHVIIPLPELNGKKRRCFLLKRGFIRISYGEGHFTDYPLEEVIEAIVRFPELQLSEGLYLLHKELDEHLSEIFGEGNKGKGRDEKEDSY